MSNLYQNIILREKIRLAGIAGGGYSFSILRPDYTAVDNTGVLIASGVQLYVQPDGMVGEDKLAGCNYFIITGDNTQFQPGDLIVCTSSDIPICTVAFDPNEQEPLLFKTPKLCSIIRNGQNVCINAYFEYLNVGGAGQSIGPGVPVSLETAARQAVMYVRPVLLINEGDSFVDTGTGVPWRVEKVDYLEKQMVLTLGAPSET